MHKVTDMNLMCIIYGRLSGSQTFLQDTVNALSCIAKHTEINHLLLDVINHGPIIRSDVRKVFDFTVKFLSKRTSPARLKIAIVTPADPLAQMSISWYYELLKTSGLVVVRTFNSRKSALVWQLKRFRMLYLLEVASGQALRSESAK